MGEREFDFDEMDAIVNARSVAIVGASASPMKFGSLFTMSQLNVGFDGSLFLVNPGETEIMGMTCYPDLRSLPEVPDLVCLMVPAHRSMQVMRDCAEAGVRGVIIMASGFREAGAEGRALEEEALGLARSGGFRIIGPNCFGIYNPRTGLTLLPGYDFTRSTGDIAFISQSGGYSVHLARQAMSLGLEMSAVVSYGNAADVDESDLLRYFARDSETSCIAGYLEGVRDGDAFAEALADAASAKPVILWKVGKGESSRRAVVSHTGSLAGSAEIWSGLLRQCGAIEASGVDEVIDVLIALKHIGPRPGRRLLVSGGGGGLGTYGADLAEASGLEVPALDPKTLAAMKKALSRAGASAGNPMDIGAPLIPITEFGAAIREAALNPTTDILVFDLALNFAYPLGGPAGLEQACDVLSDVRKESGKPIAVALYSRSFDLDDMTYETELRRLRRKLLEADVAVFTSQETALRAIARVNRLPLGTDTVR